MQTVLCHVSTISQGDTVIHEGIVRTVSGVDVKRDGFMGSSIFGDSYLCGSKLVEKVVGWGLK